MEITYEMKKKNEEVEELCRKNNVALEEIKKISEVLNYGEQIIIENEGQLGTNQIILMNIRNSVKTKKKKKAHKHHLLEKERII
jgi:16S rRNA U1498 N3-methylase RsmE